MKSMQNIFKSKKISINIKLRTFNIYIGSICLYNSELWTLTKKLENNIDIFHRRQLKSILGIYWPNKITNQELYKRTKAEQWSRTIKRRRMNWLGHLMRLHPETPARKALTEFLRPTKKTRGRPPLTWIKLMKQDLEEANIHININKPEETEEKLINLAHNRHTWHEVVRNVMQPQAALDV